MPTKPVSLIAREFGCGTGAVRRAVDFHGYPRRSAEQLATKKLLREEEDKAVELEAHRPGDEELEREPFSPGTSAYAAGFVGVYRTPWGGMRTHGRYHAYIGRVKDSFASIGGYSSVLDAARGRAQRISALATQAPTRTSTRIKKKAKLYHSRA